MRLSHWAQSDLPHTRPGPDEECRARHPGAPVFEASVNHLKHMLFVNRRIAVSEMPDTGRSA